METYAVNVKIWQRPASLHHLPTHPKRDDEEGTTDAHRYAKAQDVVGSPLWEDPVWLSSDREDASSWWFWCFYVRVGPLRSRFSGFFWSLFFLNFFWWLVLAMDWSIMVDGWLSASLLGFANLGRRKGLTIFWRVFFDFLLWGSSFSAWVPIEFELVRWWRQMADWRAGVDDDGGFRFGWAFGSVVEASRMSQWLYKWHNYSDIRAMRYLLHLWRIASARISNFPIFLVGFCWWLKGIYWRGDLPFDRGSSFSVAFLAAICCLYSR